MGNLPGLGLGMAAPHVACRRVAKTFRFLAGSIGNDILLGLRDLSPGPARRVAYQSRSLSRLPQPLRDHEYGLRFYLWVGYLSADRALLPRRDASRESVLARCLAGASFFGAFLGSHPFTARVADSSLPRLYLVRIRKSAVPGVVEWKCPLAVSGAARFSSIRLHLVGSFSLAGHAFQLVCDVNRVRLLHRYVGAASARLLDGGHHRFALGHCVLHGTRSFRLN